MKSDPQKEKKAKLKWPHLVALILLAFFASVIVALLIYASLLRAPQPNCLKDQTCQTQEFEVADGTPVPIIITNLKKAGLIKSPGAFRFYLLTTARDVVFHAGVYDLDPSMSAKALVKQIRKGARTNTFRLTFLPGGTVSDAKKILSKAGYSDADIDAAFAQNYDHPLLQTKPADASLEGYIYGDTYEFYKDASISDILTRTFDEMYRVVKDNSLIERYQQRGLSLHQGITLASIIQREAKTQDMPQVSQVFQLRLSRNISLGSDAVIAYAADQIDPNRSKTDTSYLNTVACPWNSRRCQGLPPTGINNPGKAALLAVADPAEGDYLYFLTGDDGKMYYANTEAEHNQNIQQHCQKMCQIL